MGTTRVDCRVVELFQEQTPPQEDSDRILTNVASFPEIEICISLVVPCYDEEESLPSFLDAVAAVTQTMHKTYGLRFELVLVDDGSSDGTLRIMKRAGALLPSYVSSCWVSFSRNFGKEAALNAGLKRAHGDYVALMDADMQDPPSLLPKMYELMLEKDCDNVATRRATRTGESKIRSLCSRMFYRAADSMTDISFVEGERDFRLMKRTMVDALLQMDESNRFTKGMFSWVGFKTEWLSYENVNRVAGKTKWSFRELLSYSFDGITSFSALPLTLAARIGLLCCAAAVVLLAVIVIRYLVLNKALIGLPLLICAIIGFGGLQLLFTGVIGYYLAKIYTETKGRPHYIVREENHDNY